MDPSIFHSYLQRVREATKFSQLYEIDKELSRLPKTTNPASVAYLKEEVELRSNPTVYTAMSRLRSRENDFSFSSNDNNSEDPDFSLGDEDSLDIDVIGHLSGDTPLETARLDDEEHIDKMVEKFTSQMSPKPYDASSNIGMDGLIAQPGFLEAIDQAEREERGEFPDRGPIVAKLLHDLANTGDPGDIASWVVASKEAGLVNQLSPIEKESLNDQIRERFGILFSVQRNIRLIQQSREARSMGMSLNEFIEIKSRAAREEMPLLFRSFLETVRDEAGELSQLLEQGLPGQEPSPEVLGRITERINKKTAQKIRDKKAIDSLIESLGHPPSDEPPAPRKPAR